MGVLGFVCFFGDSIRIGIVSTDSLYVFRNDPRREFSLLPVVLSALALVLIFLVFADDDDDANDEE